MAWSVYGAPGYSYAAPLRRWLRERNYRVLVVPPPETARLILDGTLSAGLVPIGSVLENPGIKLCPGPMVYSWGVTLSVAVFSYKPMRLTDCRAVAVTAETRTSVKYLSLVLDRLGADTVLVASNATSASKLLELAPCALVIGDEALRALASGAHLVADLGEYVSKLFGIEPVYAATAVNSVTPCPYDLAEPPWPQPVLEDVLETVKTAGLDTGMSWLYHGHLLRFDYNPTALYKALTLLEEGIESPVTRVLPRQQT